MINGMTHREGLSPLKIVVFISFVDWKRDPESSKLSGPEQTEVRR
jgi:hypothetical protein